MKIIEIKATPFFELIKLKGQSMWDIFAQMIDGEEKELVFLDDENKPLFHFILPKKLEELKEIQKEFAKEYSDKIAGFN
ncbi:hypothetical protein [Halpernia sp.]|uniref:hypothetical protein n=1 Tax=Halpernia sp. TaxID=2782209 RepID=UPI003A9594D3